MGIRLTGAAVLCVFIAGCGDTCKALCLHGYTVALVDAQDAGVAPGIGQVTVGVTKSSFECAPDKFGGGAVECLTNAVVIRSRVELSEVTLAVTELGGGRTFDGVVPLVVSARQFCGQRCTTASTTVTMR